MSSEEIYGTEFQTAYVGLMAGVWNSEKEEADLLSDPTAYAISKGLPVQPGATVKLDRSQPDGFLKSDDLVRDWTQTPGMHILHVPAEEIIKTGELTDSELETVGAGAGTQSIVIVIACVVIA